MRIFAPDAAEEVTQFRRDAHLRRDAEVRLATAGAHGKPTPVG